MNIEQLGELVLSNTNFSDDDHKKDKELHQLITNVSNGVDLLLPVCIAFLIILSLYFFTKFLMLIYYGGEAVYNL